MFAYCNNNPVARVDSNGEYPLQAAFEFLGAWLFGKKDERHYSNNSRISRELKKSKTMRSIVDKAIDDYRSGQSTPPGTGELTANEDGYELYLSTQHFSYTVDVATETRSVGFGRWKHEEIRHTATVVVSDIYNFDSLRDWNSFGNIMNNIAYLYHLAGGGNDFAWTATYTYSTKWTDKA